MGIKKAIVLGALALGVHNTVLPQNGNKKVSSDTAAQVVKGLKDTANITYVDSRDGNTKVITESIGSYIETKAASDANKILSKGDLLSSRNDLNLEKFKSYIGIVHMEDVEKLTSYIDSIVSTSSKGLYTSHQKEVYRKELIINILEHMSWMADKFGNNGTLEYGTKISDGDQYDLKGYSNHENLSVSVELKKNILDLQNQIKTNKIQFGSSSIDKNEGVADEILRFYNKVYRVYEKAAQYSSLKKENKELKSSRDNLRIMLRTTMALLIIFSLMRGKTKKEG